MLKCFENNIRIVFIKLLLRDKKIPKYFQVFWIRTICMYNNIHLKLNSIISKMTKSTKYF